LPPFHIVYFFLQLLEVVLKVLDQLAVAENVLLYAEEVLLRSQSQDGCVDLCDVDSELVERHRCEFSLKLVDLILQIHSFNTVFVPFGLIRV